MADIGSRLTQVTQGATAMNRQLADFYRFPDDAVKFSVQGRLSADAGFFKFGENLICFGQSSTGFRSSLAKNELYDTFKDLGQQGSTVMLPFNPTDIINNLRQERYSRQADHRVRGVLRDVVRNTYYLFRPALNVTLRRRLQKIHLNGWHQLSFPSWPVDRTVDQLMRKMLGIGLQAAGCNRTPFIWFWPNGANACSIMTHDVETVAGLNFCQQLMDINEKFSIPASFQIVPEKRYPVSPAFLKSIRDRGFEINIQDLNHDGQLFTDWNEFRRRADKINDYAQKYQARGFRAAVLYRNQEWYKELNFEYDMSVPNVAHLDPQRGGCCTVMPYFIGKTLELPVTTTQDYSLFHILNDYSLSLWKQQVELILKDNGLISFIIHPDYIIRKNAQDIYKQLLEMIGKLRKERNVWLALPREVNDWWRQRHQMQLIQRDGKWRIEGPGSEKARVAFATVSEGRVEYSIS